MRKKPKSNLRKVKQYQKKYYVKEAHDLIEPSESDQVTAQL